MKLLELQKRIKAIKKDSINPFFKSSYFDINALLAEIKPILNELDLVILQPLKVKEGKNVVSTQIIEFNAKREQDEVIAGSEIMLPDISDPQKLGSAITYYRRYSLQSLLSLEAEDDDANTASNKVQSNKSNNW